MGSVAVIIVAAGSSSRLGGDVPKPYRILGDKTVLEYSLDVFAADARIDPLLLVVNPEHQKHYAPIADAHNVWLVPGGNTRQESVFAGLDALADNPPDWVLVHDAARPGVSAELIDRVLGALDGAPGAIPAIAVKDTIKRTEAGHVLETLPRDALKAVQTPQGFHYTELLAAHMAAHGVQYTDDAAIMEAAGLPVAVVEGEENNAKLTTPVDWQHLSVGQSGHDGDKQTRIGQGFDVHRLIHDAVRPLMLCGLAVPSPFALAGHSDADVALHALVDALLGAIGQGDIGEHFPPSDARWHNADSALFAAEAMRLLRAQGGVLINADITIIAQEPKLSPHKAAMRARVAQLLGVDAAQVNIKATTTEGLGLTGRREGIAAQAVVSVQC